MKSSGGFSQYHGYNPVTPTNDAFEVMSKMET